MRDGMHYAPNTVPQTSGNELLYHPCMDVTTMTMSELQRELTRARTTISALHQEITETTARHVELTRAYQLTVANLVKTTKACAALVHERERWRAQAEARPATASFTSELLILSSVEIAAMRKAMARLHHPDTGGNAERMKMWNAVLDALEENATSRS